MAKGNMLQGQATGKVGDIVFMVRNGQQVARVYTSAGGRSGDQASIAVRRQRVRFGAASNQYLLYRNIVRGMYRTGKSTKQSDYNYFVIANVDLLPYLTRDENAAGIHCVQPGTFSRGTLGAIIYNIIAALDDDENSTYSVKAVGGSLGSTFQWEDSVGDAKAVLKTTFSNARKVNYSCCVVTPRGVETPSGLQYTHDIKRYDVIFDLYEEDANVPDTASVKEYFSYYLTDSVSQGVIAAQTGYCQGLETYLRLEMPGSSSMQGFNRLYVNVFATNNQVGDCYTTTCLSLTSTDNGDGLGLYNALRTDDHRQVAEDSYGYTTGVMRTDIQQA